MSVQVLHQIMKIQTAKGLGKVLQKMKIVSASEGMCKMKLLVEDEHVNVNNFLHGGTVATIIDLVTTNALELSPLQARGVSVDLNVSYLRPVKIGEEITVTSRCVKAGRSLAFLEAELLDSKGNMVATGTHTKFVGKELPTT